MPDNKPIVEGPVNGNVYAVLAAAKLALRKAGQVAQAEELQNRFYEVQSYDEALRLFMEYVDFDL